MTITRADVADLRPGDVVEVRDDRWPGVVIKGPLVEKFGSLLRLRNVLVRDPDGNPSRFARDQYLTVVSRVPRPLYVNHDRTEPVPGDVVRDADSDDARSWSYADPKHTGEFCWRNTGRNGWCRRGDLPRRLRLLVDGETGQVVP